MNWARSTKVARAFRRTALPLASYYVVTLALPLANGAAQSGAFVGHAVVVLVVPPVAIILVCAVHTVAHALASAWRAAGRRQLASFVREFRAVFTGESEHRRFDSSGVKGRECSRDQKFLVSDSSDCGCHFGCTAYSGRQL